MNIVDFINESNHIEGINRAPTNEEIQEYERFMARRIVTVHDLQQFVAVYQPDAVLRSHEDIPGVQVGNHVAPPSGPVLLSDLHDLLNEARSYEIGGTWSPYNIHQWYETLHPFTDGNGRSGRMLWMWMMRTAPLGFLHTYYYQSLSRGN